MSQHVFEIEPFRTLPVVGSATVFPVRRVYCIGRNYAAHAREMGGDPTREAPFFFLKPNDSVQPVPAGETVTHPYPPGTSDYHHEIELVACLHTGGRDIPVETALDCVFGYAVGLDMTRRDLQQGSKDRRQPWENGKSADHSAPCGPITPMAQSGHLVGGQLSLTVNDKPRQSAPLAAMIWSVAEQIAILSQFYELKAGDIIFTGTPEGVASVSRGDLLVGSVQSPDINLTPIHVRIG